MRVLAVALIWTLLGLPAALPGAGAQDGHAGELIAELADRCAPGADPPPADADDAFSLAVPDGVEAGSLGAATAQELPARTDFVLAAGRLSLPPEAESKRRRAVGPLLLVVERGTVSVSVNGRSRDHGTGASVLIEPSQLYAVSNPDDVPASALMVGVVPPEGETSIGAPGGVPDFDPLPDEEERVDRQRFFGGAVTGLAREETFLFLACLAWADAGAELASDGYPGPVGLLDLGGHARVNGGSLSAGDCRLIPAFAPVRIGADEAPSAVLLFGALPASEVSRLADEPSGSPVQPSDAAGGDCVGLETDDRND